MSADLRLLRSRNRRCRVSIYVKVGRLLAVAAQGKGGRSEWHLLNLLRVSILPDLGPCWSTCFHQHGVRLGSSLSGVLQLSASSPSVVLRLRRSNSTCHRSLNRGLREAFGTCCGQLKVVTKIFPPAFNSRPSAFQVPLRNRPDSSRTALPLVISAQPNDLPTPRTAPTESPCCAVERHIVRTLRPRLDVAVHTVKSRWRSRHRPAQCHLAPRYQAWF